MLLNETPVIYQDIDCTKKSLIFYVSLRSGAALAILNGSQFII